MTAGSEENEYTRIWGGQELYVTVTQSDGQDHVTGGV